jgi:uncharacterized tellurite resistance protein B-like protein
VSSSAIELCADCRCCKVGGAVLELFDPEDPPCALGVFAIARCRFCAASWRGVTTPPTGRGRPGACPACAATLDDAALEAHRCPACGAHATIEQVAAGALPGDAAALELAMARWAAEENVEPGRFFADTFGALGPTEVLAALAAGHPIATSVDGFGLLFPGRAGGALRGRLSLRPPPAAEPERKGQVEAMVLCLLSVMAADGVLAEAERAFVDRFLAEEGAPPVRAEDVREQRPIELAPAVPPGRRERLLESMVELAAIDGVPDRSELRVIRAYASAWRIPERRVEDWVEIYELRHASRARRLLYRLRDVLWFEEEKPR